MGTQESRVNIGRDKEIGPNNSSAELSSEMPMQAFVHRVTRKLIELWWESGSGDSSLKPRTLPLGYGYPRQGQRTREASLRGFLETLSGILATPPRNATERLASQERILTALDILMAKGLGFTKEQRELLLSEAFIESAIQFAQMARRFDPQITIEAIFQASRNIFTMNSIQVLLGLPIRLTPAIFAYSMLYPYTDNYLDDPVVPPTTKLAFNRQFALRLQGDPIPPANAQEQKIHDLVGMIEGQFDRARDPLVFASLLAIHRAQVRSLQLLRPHIPPYEVDVLGISLEKGGTSVLADGYLVAGSLTEAQAECLFDYGAFLQIADDLQDIRKDSRDGLQTVFSQTARCWPLDKLTGHALRFGNHISQGLAAFGTPDAEPLQELMRLSATQLIVQAAGQARHLHTAPFIRELEAHSPFRFDFLSACGRRIARQRPAMLRFIEAFTLTDKA